MDNVFSHGLWFGTAFAVSQDGNTDYTDETDIHGFHLLNESP